MEKSNLYSHVISEENKCLSYGCYFISWFPDSAWHWEMSPTGQGDVLALPKEYLL